MHEAIHIRKVGSQSDIALIKLRGFLDTVSAYDLQQQGEELIQGGIYKYIFNFEQLEYISSAGIETFHGIAQKLQKHQGKMIFSNVPEKIYKVFEIIGTTIFFRFTPTIPEAIKELEAL